MTEVVVIRISDEQLGQAEARATAAEEERDVAARELEAAPYSDVVALRHTEASRVAARLRANARELREAYEGQVAAERTAASREEREKAVGKEITAAERELKAAAGKLEAAAVAAQDGLVVLLKATEAYDALVERHAGVLGAAGLGLDGDTGGGQRLFGMAVRVRGRLFASASPGAVLLWVAQRVAEARLPRLSPARAGLTGLAGYRAWERRGDELLAGVTPLAPVVHAESPRMVRPVA